MQQRAVMKLVHGYTTLLFSVLHHVIEIAMVALIAGAIYVLSWIALRLWDWRQFLRQKYVVIEITPPITADKTPLQAKEWMTQLHGIGSHRDQREHIQRIFSSLSLELSSTRREGVRFFVRVPSQEANDVKSAITTHLNKPRIRMVDDYLPPRLHYKTAKVLDFKLTGVYYLPLGIQDSFKAYDPFEQLANAMASVSDDEEVVFQVMFRPANIKDAALTRERIKRNEDMLAHAKQQLNSGSIVRLAFGLVFTVLREVVMFITDVVYNTPTGSSMASSQQMYEHRVRHGIMPTRSITPAEQVLNDSILDKVDQKLFRAEVRVLVVTNREQQTRLRAKTMRAALSAYDTEHQQLRAVANFPAFVFGRYRLFKFTHRLPSLFQRHANILSASEIAGMYHFPVPGNAADSLVQSLHYTLPAALSQKRGDHVDVIVGRNIHQDQRTDIGLSSAVRMKHMYIIGSTGTGKTTLLTSMIYQDMRLNTKIWCLS